MTVAEKNKIESLQEEIARLHRRMDAFEAEARNVRRAQKAEFDNALAVLTTTRNAVEIHTRQLERLELLSTKQSAASAELF